MGSQQLLLLILGVIVVGIATSVGIAMFSGQTVEANKVAIIGELTSIAEDARVFYMRPTTLGGGGRSYRGYVIPRQSLETSNATYSCIPGNRRVRFQAVSKQNPQNIITVTLRRTGDDVSQLLANWTYSGDFQQ
jgi:hypothetical protein